MNHTDNVRPFRRNEPKAPYANGEYSDAGHRRECMDWIREEIERKRAARGGQPIGTVPVDVPSAEWTEDAEWTEAA